MLLAQLTDLHVGVSFANEPRGFSAADRAAVAVRYLNELAVTPAAVVLTGDLTADGRPQEYAELREVLRDLRAPYFLLPGNHDDRTELRAAFSDHEYLFQQDDKLCFVIDDIGSLTSGPAVGLENHDSDDAKIRLIGLDTLEPGAHAGRLGSHQLQWLDRTLAARPDVRTAVWLHHPPFHTSMPIFDAMGCADGDQLAAVIERHAQVELVASGHVHRSIQVQWAGTLAIAMSSTAFQYPLYLAATEDKLLPDFQSGSVGLTVWLPGRPVISHEKRLAFADG